LAFLRALERTGQARAAADDAGVDHTTAYARRRMHADFALAWEAALKAHKERVKRERDEEMERLDARLSAGQAARLDPSTITSSGNGPPPDPSDREELIVSGNRLKRASPERWGKRKQEAFLAELAATGNLRLASKAVGISYEAVRKRRIRDPQLDAACKAAIEACRARIPEFLAGAAVQTFDPQSLPDPDSSPLPKVTIAEAIQIAKLPRAEPRPEGIPDNYEYAGRGESRPRVRTLDEVRDSILEKVEAFAKKMRADRQRLGWTWDEVRQVLIPPGWVRDPQGSERQGEGS
jgi:hypothetical protein